MTEINHIATKSNITVASLMDFKSICTNLGINDSNVEKYIGEYCFIEIGSSLNRLPIQELVIRPRSKIRTEIKL